MVNTRALLFSLAAVAFAGQAGAWGSAGHRLVADIAAARLTPQARKEVLWLLGDDLDAEGKPSGRRTLASVSVWADEFRRTDAGKITAPWHYDNQPICHPENTATPVTADSCPDSACASRQLDEHVKVLADRNASRRDRNEALKWIVHLVGDIHQPLHQANNYDRGGNDVRVSFFGVAQDDWGSLNLHGIWDTQMVDRLLAQTPRGAKAIVRQESRRRDRASWESGSTEDWIAESHELAVHVAYAKLPVQLACGQPPEKILALGDAYFAQAAPVIDSQLRKAGVRLAALIERALATSRQKGSR